MRLPMMCAGVLELSLVFTAAANAEIRFEDDDEATQVLMGGITNVEKKIEPIGKGGLMTRYRFTFKVDKVIRGDGIKEGQSITVKGFAITKKPGGTFVGAYGQRLRTEKASQFEPFVPAKGQKLNLLLSGQEDGIYQMLYPYGARPLKK